MRTFLVEDRNALKKNEKTSGKREVYIDKHELAKFYVETQTEEAWEIFNKMPEHTLAPLPAGYQWVANKKYSIVREESTNDHELRLILFGPNTTKKINYLFLIDGVTAYSFAHAQKNSTLKRAYPMSLSDYKVPGYNYSKTRFSGHVRGHLIDLPDTIISQGIPYSSDDRRNYIPEPPEYEWGLGIRRLKVQEIRKTGGAYAQLSVYLKEPWKTANNTSVPDNIYFYHYTSNPNNYVYTSDTNVLNVSWEEDLSRPKGHKVLAYASNNFTSSTEAVPVVVPYDPISSDRDLRYLGRNTLRKIDDLTQKKIHSHSPQHDKLVAQWDAGDKEFESSTRKLNTAIYAGTVEEFPLSKNYIVRSLDFAESLNELDDSTIELFSNEIVREGFKFFKNNPKLDLDDEFYDHFKQLTTKDDSPPPPGKKTHPTKD
jgi:hypothetical protein